MSRTILVVEDEELVREFTVDLLGELGYRVLSASNGRDALELLEREPRVDLLFTDIVMPGELDGFALAREARQRRPRLPVLYTSGYTNRVGENAAAASLGKMLPKPYRPDQLRDEIRRALDPPCDSRH
jgi:CheY-like chemotaxis protein